jgi:hypothetical protein
MSSLSATESGKRLKANWNKELINPERRWVLIYALIILSLTTIPYLIGYSLQDDEWRFTGFVFGVEDGNSYIAKMASGEAGAWLFRTPYTAYPQNGVLAFLPYILLGKMAAFPGVHVQLVSLYHIFRWIAGILAISATYDFLSYFLDDLRLRRWGLVLATVGGGLGWILVLVGRDQWFGSLPLEFYSPETFGFLSLYGIPHLLLARACLLWGVLGVLRAPIDHKNSALRAGLIVGGFWLVTALAQPLTAVLFGFILGLYILALGAWQLWHSYKQLRTNWNRWRKTIILGIWSSILPLPFLLYNVIVFNIDPFLQAWTEQNVIPSPHPIHYLLAYGLVLPFSFVGGMRMVRRNPWVAWLPVSWALAIPFLAYIPLNLQRRFPEGVWVVLVTLSMYAFSNRRQISIDMPGVQQSRIGDQRWRSAWLIILLLLFSSLSTLILIVGGALAVRDVGLPLYRPDDEVAVFEYLATEGKPWSVVLSTYDTGNALPAWAPMRVVIGHGPESIGHKELSGRVAEFYDLDTNDTQRFDLITEFNIDYIFWGPKERALGDWNPKNAPYLDIAYELHDYYLYTVQPLGEN